MTAKQLKDLHTRINEMSSGFQDGLNKLKKMCTEYCASTQQVSDFRKDIMNKFENLEKSVASQLLCFKEKIADVQKEMQLQTDRINLLEKDRNRGIVLLHGVEENITDPFCLLLKSKLQ